MKMRSIHREVLTVIFVILILLLVNSIYLPITAETPGIKRSSEEDSIFPQSTNDQVVPLELQKPLEEEKNSIRDKDNNKVSDLIDVQVKEGYFKIDAILIYSCELQEGHIQDLHNVGVTIGTIFWTLDMVSIYNVPVNTIYHLAKLPDIARVENPGKPILYSDVATPAVKARESKLYSPTTAWEVGYTGIGANIAVVDTGADNGHPTLQGKWVGGVDLSKPEIPILNPYDGSKDADDTNGHGTTCSGIAMGTGAPEGIYMGAAPGAKLVDVRIGTMIGYAPGELLQSYYDASLKGIEWVIEHRETSWAGQGDENKGIDILSLSWGIDVGGESDGSDPYSRALDMAVESGIIVCHAAGNSGPSNNGFDGFAAASNGISVAASDDQDTIERSDDIIAEYSSRGPRHDNGDENPYNELKPDITAPGTHIMQAQFDVLGDGSGNGYGNRGSGTSYATPVVAGVCALMHEANPKLTPELMREILHFTSERRSEPTIPELDPFWNKDFGYGVVDAYKAVKLSEQITNINDIDVNLQCFITNVERSKDNISSGKVTVEGLAFSKTGNLEKIELSVDNGTWRTIKNTKENGIFLNWSFELDTTELSNGDHTLKARALSSSSQSLVDSMFISTKNKKKPKLGLTTEQLMLSGAVILILTVAVLVYFYNKKKKNQNYSA